MQVEGLKISETLQQRSDANGPNPLKIKGRICDFTSCEKRLKLTDMARPCLCTKIFCDSHRFYLTHKCTFDHAARDRAKLEASMQQRRFNHNTQNPGGSGVN